jgi:4-oxalocrotonate tautomerase
MMVAAPHPLRSTTPEEGTVPEIIIEMAEGRSVDQKRALVQAMTRAMVEILNVQPDEVTIIIHENPKTDKAKGGVLFADR